MIGYSTLIPLHRVQSLRLTPLSVKQFSSLVCKLSHLAQPSWREGPKKKKTQKEKQEQQMFCQRTFSEFNRLAAQTKSQTFCNLYMIQNPCSLTKPADHLVPMGDFLGRGLIKMPQYLALSLFYFYCMPSPPEVRASCIDQNWPTHGAYNTDAPANGSFASCTSYKLPNWLIQLGFIF